MKFWLLLAAAASLFGEDYKVQTPAGVVVMTSEAYVAGVVTGESGDFKSDEALKAMAVAARTYAARMQGRHASEGFDFCSLTHCQRYVKPSATGTRAASQTAGQMLWFQGKPAFAVYSQSCGGKIEAVHDVWPDIQAPYLTSHADPYCSRSWTWSGQMDQIRQALTHAGLRVPAQAKTISVVQRTSSGRAAKLSVGGELISASSFRFALGRFIGWNTVRSDLYTVENDGPRILFRGSGDGHGVGLCQAGADAMGMQGRSYLEILKFYYPGAVVSVNAADFHWTRLSGEGVTLYSMRMDSDRALISEAERVLNRWKGRLPWPVPHSIDIYVYPDLDSFRNATGEPGWVAARTSGAKIEMQPSQLLRSHNALNSTLEHELLHCFVESAARPGLPVWFREGLVEHLAGAPAVTGGTSSEQDIRQRSDRQAAERAYQEAQRRVQGLITRYGETAVLAWVTAGLPDEVKNSRASSPAVNNK